MIYMPFRHKSIDNILKGLYNKGAFLNGQLFYMIDVEKQIRTAVCGVGVSRNT